MQYRHYKCYGLCVLYFISLTACQPSATNTTTTSKDSTATTTTCNVNEYMTGAVLYQQQSGEYRALAYQAFSLAKMMLNDSLKKKKRNDTLAIITDLDETMLDNSKYDAQMILKNSSDWNLWGQWVNAKQADSLPGSVSFLKYADSKKVHIYYISNRNAKDVGSTMENMHQLGFPQLDSSHFYFNTGNSNKQDRFDGIIRRKNYKVIMQLGDNLNDFSGDYYGKTPEERRKTADAMAATFGTKYIVLPNATYGAWLDALYNKTDTSSDQKYNRRHSLLSGF